MIRNPPANAGDIRDVALVLGWGRSPGVGHGNPLQYSCLRNPMDRGVWRAIVQRVTKSQIGLKQLSTHKNWYIEIILVYNILKRTFSSFCGVFKRLPRLRSTQTVNLWRIKVTPSC